MVYIIFTQYGIFCFVGKMNCGRSRQLCDKLGVNRYPMWGVLKPGGAFELHHGKNTNNDIIKFVQISAKATNVWALTAEKTLSILQRNSGIICTYIFNSRILLDIILGDTDQIVAGKWLQETKYGF